ncbi:hypothetical protein B0H10DRAFT_2216186 [Mycena sp. CBHHK59/15]|nr:hypothetical protein B0H10DRAFT_2220855 [Mycena sp. CBHHK59/15]KAJ6620137.1 hypothetical protein B0H10DRAFT_2216186 [Mycena sp. CBHHK59/15]
MSVPTSQSTDPTRLQEDPAQKDAQQSGRVPAQPLPDVGIDPRFRVPFASEHAAAAKEIAEQIANEGDMTLPESSQKSTSTPVLPVPCIGIGPSARIPYTEEHNKEAKKIGVVNGDRGSSILEADARIHSFSGIGILCEQDFSYLLFEADLLG